jgi:putative ABC transport system permease protein
VQFAVDHHNYFDLVPEIVVPPDQMDDFMKQRNAVIVGRKLADRFYWKVGDVVRLTGTVFPGEWDFVIRGIYTGAEENTDESMWLMRWDYVDERMRQEAPGRAGWIGSFLVQIDDPQQAAAISEKIDSYFANSQNETLTETEEAFNLSFVAMASSIVLGLKVISILVIGVILLVLGNTMAMTARERVSEYAVMKTLGFRPIHLIGLIFGESLFMAALGAVFGLLISAPVLFLIKTALETFFPVFAIQTWTLALAVTASLTVGILAAVFPAVKAIYTPIVDGLRIID